MTCRPKKKKLLVKTSKFISVITDRSNKLHSHNVITFNHHLWWSSCSTLIYFILNSVLVKQPRGTWKSNHPDSGNKAENTKESQQSGRRDWSVCCCSAKWKSFVSVSAVHRVHLSTRGLGKTGARGDTKHQHTHQTNRRFISKSSNPPREVTTGVSGHRVEDEVQGREFDSHGLSQRGMNQQERIWKKWRERNLKKVKP